MLGYAHLRFATLCMTFIGKTKAFARPKPQR